jgi:hypothetical protein
MATFVSQRNDPQSGNLNDANVMEARIPAGFPTPKAAKRTLTFR